MASNHKKSKNDSADTALSDVIRVRITARGRVQGVGFRPTLYRAVVERGGAGCIKNTPQGAVLEIESEPAIIEEIIDNFGDIAPHAAEVRELEIERIESTGQREFCIDRSSADGRSLLPIPPDLATCPECKRELTDPENRRAGYPFNTCTACGPRFTIARSVPFDRDTSAMDEFPQCRECSREYREPEYRRFHAQTISCPECGPELSLRDASGNEYESPIQEAAHMLRNGSILAIKGIGGFHLACDAGNDEAVGTLRRRKDRPHKPFAVMTGHLEACETVCQVNDFERDVLTSSLAPIVLLRKKPDSPVAESVAPGLKYLGVMLAYTPLHQLILTQPDMPPALVMTSCNRAEEPIALNERAVWNDLADVVDAVLTHNRQIVNRADDSVVATFDEKVLPARRSRGYVPEPVLLKHEGPPVFATGAMLKNTFAVTSGHRVFLSQHIGNVSDADNAAHFARAFDRFSNLLKFSPRAVVCDMHPDYPTTAFAEKLSRERDLKLLKVQHHHAHIASCLAENAHEGHAIGVSMDGTGYGEDGAIWGGEFLVASLDDYSRKYHLDYVPMPGGEQAVIHTDRMAAAHLAHALGRDEALERMSEIMGEDQCRTALDVMDKRSFSPLTSSCGRLFDAVSALLGVRHRITYRGQAACELEMICNDGEDASYDFGYEDDSITLKGLFAGVCADIDAGLPAGRIAARFHNTVADMMVETCDRLRRETGLDTVALSGGVMQNRRLLSLAVPALRERGFEVLLQSKVPANDGGICLGQAAVALAQLENEGDE